MHQCRSAFELPLGEHLTMKLVVAKPNLPDREIGIVAVNGHRLVTDEGVFCLTPLADEWGQSIADGDKLPPFGMVKVSPVLDRPDLTVEFPEEAKDQYERHLAYCKEHKLTPGTRAQHKAWEQAELERVSGLPDDVRPYCLTDLELDTLAVGVRGGLSADSKVRFRAFFQSGEEVTKWFLEDFQPVAPLVAEAQLTKSAEFLRQRAALADQDKQSIEKRESLANLDAQHIQKRELLAADDGEIISEMEVVTEKLGATADAVRKATAIGDLYSNPTMADAKDAAIRRGVPKEFVAYCFTEMHAQKFPSSRQAASAVKTEPLFMALRQEPHSHSTVFRWIRVVDEELIKRGLREPRRKGPSAKPAAGYDVEKRPAPEPDDVEKEPDDPQGYA